MGNAYPKSYMNIWATSEQSVTFAIADSCG